MSRKVSEERAPRAARASENVARFASLLALTVEDTPSPEDEAAKAVKEIFRELDREYRERKLAKNA